MSTSYEITFNNEVFTTIFKFDQQEGGKNSLILRGNWYPDFVRMIQTTEQHQYVIKPTGARLNPASKKANAPFLLKNMSNLEEEGFPLCEMSVMTHIL